MMEKLDLKTIKKSITKKFLIKGIRKEGKYFLVNLHCLRESINNQEFDRVEKILKLLERTSNKLMRFKG